MDYINKTDSEILNTLEHAQTQLTMREKLGLKAKTGGGKLSDSIRIAVLHYLNCKME